MFPSISAGAAALLAALAQAIAPRPDITPWEWGEGRIVIPAEANTSRPGPLSWEGFEYCLEPLERLDYRDSCSRVAIMAAGQTGKSNIGVVWTFWSVVEAPRPIGLAVPSRPKAQAFNSKKLQPVIDKTPELSGGGPDNLTARINAETSTTSQKNYPGGALTIFSAGSVNDLQSESFGAVWITESPNFMEDLAGRGSPMTQIRVRMDGWETVGTKELHESTPGEEGACPVSADFEAGDQRMLYLPCPHCAHSFTIEWDDFVVPEDASEEPHILPPCCGDTLGAIVSERHLPAMKRAIRARLKAEHEGRELGPELAAGYLPTFQSKHADNPSPARYVSKSDFTVWRARRVEGRQPSYHFWQVVSPLKTWRGLAQDWRDAQGKPTEEAAFRQQKLGRPTEAAVKAPGHLDLLSAAQVFKRRRGEIPPGTCWLSGVADVQGDRLEWAVHAHGPTFRARIDRGVIEHDPLGVEAWAELARVVARRWEGPECRSLGLDAFGVDSGGVDGVTPRVYEFVRSRANCYAIKGASTSLPLPTDVRRIKGRDTKGRTIRVALLLVDTYVFKRFTAYSLRNLVASSRQTPDPIILPGSVLFEDDATEEDFRQLTAEGFKRPPGARPGQRGEWVNVERRPNEQLDLDVYAQALAYQKGLQRWDQARWEAEFHARARDPGSPAEPPLLVLAEAAPGPEAPRAVLAGNAKTAEARPRRRQVRSGYMGG